VSTRINVNSIKPPQGADTPLKETIRQINLMLSQLQSVQVKQQETIDNHETRIVALEP
jgi:hypothetical protein